MAAGVGGRGGCSFCRDENTLADGGGPHTTLKALKPTDCTH